MPHKSLNFCNVNVGYMQQFPNSFIAKFPRKFCSCT